MDLAPLTPFTVERKKAALRRSGAIESRIFAGQSRGRAGVPPDIGAGRSYDGTIWPPSKHGGRMSTRVSASDEMIRTFMPPLH